MLAARSTAARRPNRRVLSALGALLVGVWISACGAAETRRPRFEDWVVDGGLRSSLGEPEPAREAYCADENRFAQPLRPGEELSVTVALGQAPRLVLSSCISRPVRAERGGGTLRLRVTAAEATGTLEEAWPVPAFSRWEDHELDLSGFADQTVTLQLAAELPAGRTLYLRELFLAHRLAVAPVTRPTARKVPRQILLISADTLREDALGVLGGVRPTPALDAFAEQAELFAPHYSTAAWTQPAHAALLTGQPHRVHGASDGKSAIHPAVPTLAERFRGAGFATAGLTFDCLWLDPRFGFDRGFDQYRSTHWTLPQSVRRSLDWMDEHRDQPFFYFLHTFEAHSDFRRLPYEGPGVRPRHVAERFGLDDYGCREGHCASLLLMEINQGAVAPLANEAEVLRYLYDRGVDHLDAQLGVLFAGLRQRGLFDRMLIVLTSDHGESFLEHGKALHGHSWEEVVRVPLLVKWPDGERAGERWVGATSALDVAPTVLLASGLPVEGLPGADLRRGRSNRPIFIGANFQAVIDGRFKAVIDPRDGSRRLFDLAADPAESHDLAAELPAELERLEAVLREREAKERRWAQRLETLQAGDDRARGLTEEERRRLRALGYVDG